MAFRQLTDSQCGQSNPLVQMSSLVSKDHAFVDRMGMPTSVSNENNSMAPQSFRMTDLINEMNQIESPHDSHIAMSQSFTRTTEANPWNSSFASTSTHQPPQSTYFYNQVPQIMYLPYQVEPNEIMEGLLESQSDFTELSTEDEAKYIVIKSLADLENAQEIIEEPPQVQPLEASKPILHQNNLNKPKNRREEAFSRLIKDGEESMANGNIPGAVRYFKLAMKVDKTSAEGWKLLGIALTDNAENVEAIAALKQGLNLEPYNLEILMALAECYANQGNIPRTVSTLLAWLEHHPAYKDLVPENFELRNAFNCNDRSKLLHFKSCTICSNVYMVQKMLCEAAQRRPINIDYQVQNALGLFLYVYSDYNKALDCFRAALQVRPRDSRLWNRSGVILSNLGRYEEALKAYFRALRLNKGFVLSRYNCAMTLIDMNVYEGAAKMLLTIINQQANERDNMHSSDIHARFNKTWWNLALCISHIKCIDLQTARKNMDLETLNKEIGAPAI